MASASGGQSIPSFDIAQAIAVILEKHGALSAPHSKLGQSCKPFYRSWLPARPYSLWLLTEDEPIRQRIAFVYPKGLRNFTDNFNNPKVQFSRRIKDLQLESYLVSQTYRHDLRWPDPSDAAKQANASVYRDHPILCAKDDPDRYIVDLVQSVMA